MVTVSFDPAHGGRWTSLRAGGREWLWHRDTPARASVRPGDPFVDAGGLEECIPTVRGVPDHGSAWSRPWSGGTVDCGDFRLRRAFTSDGDALVADYRLSARPVGVSCGPRTLCWTSPPMPSWRHHPESRRASTAAGSRAWPTPLARLGPDDGTATGAILVDCPSVTVADGERLTFRLDAPGQPTSTALWRNLRGWPPGSPYRSIGVEPMLGRAFDAAEAAPDDAAVVPPSGTLSWRLTVFADLGEDR